jgi:integrase
VALLYFLGQRIGDTVRMGPQMVVRGAMRITQQKTGTTLTIAMHSRLVQIIDEDAPKGAMLYLLNERGKPLSVTSLRIRLQKWAAERGVKVVPHGLRKSAVNGLITAGCTFAEISSITGQSLQMVEHYAKQRNTEELSRSAVVKMEAWNKRAT